MAEHNISYTGWLEGVQSIRATLGGKKDRTVLSQWELVFWEWPYILGFSRGRCANNVHSDCGLICACYQAALGMTSIWMGKQWHGTSC